MIAIRLVAVVPLLAGLAAVIAAGPSRAQQPRFDVGPPPEWVQPLELEPNAQPRAGASDTALRDLLREEQLRVDDGRETRFVRTISQITSAQGVEDLGRFEVSFDPEYERLTIHGIWRTRGTDRVSLFQPGEVRIIQAEKELDSQIYNGSLTALVFLEDLRVGDVVEFAYTLTGSNPVFAGHFMDRFLTQRWNPMDRLSFRLLFPSDRKLFVKGHGTRVEPTRTPGPQHTEYRWEVRDAPAVSWEDRVPSDVDLYPYVELSEFETWGDVVRWALPLYTPPTTLTPGLRTQVEALRQAGSDDEARFLAAARFVQDDLRYLSVSMGHHSHAPHTPDEVLRQRFGDCKDKSLLLATLLQHLGFEAAVAVVNTKLRDALELRHPSAVTFDHAIVWARVGDRDVWIDPTAQFERGSLDHLVPPRFKRGLVLAPGTEGFLVIPQEATAEPIHDLEEEWTLGEGRSAVLRTRFTYRGAEANGLRRYLAVTPQAELERDALNAYSRTDPEIRRLTPLEVEDDPVRNEVIVRQSFRVEAFWSDGGRELWLDLLRARLDTPSYVQRLHPLGLLTPGKRRQRITVVGTGDFSEGPRDQVIQGPGWKLEATSAFEDQTARLEGTLSVLEDRVPPGRMTAHLAAIQKVWPATYAAIPFSKAGQRIFSPETAVRAQLWIGIIVVTGLGFLMMLVIGWRSVRSRRDARVRAGTTMERALVVRSEQELSTRLSAQRCQCGSPSPGLAGMSREGAVILEGRERTPLRWTCPTCKRLQRTWIVVDDASEAA